MSANSYPDDCFDELFAKSLAAARALDDLKTKTSARHNSLPLSSEQNINKRIPEMVRRHFGGLWDAQLVADYEERFGEQLPSNWRAIVDKIDCIAIVPLLNNRSMLRCCEPGEVRSIYKMGGSLFPRLRAPSRTSMWAN